MKFLCKTPLLIFFIIVYFLSLQNIAEAAINTGVGTRRITVYEKIQPGTTYTLPPMSVFNTGTEPSYYDMRTVFHTSQNEMKFDPGWITYSPERFYLQPGEFKKVEVLLSIPLFSHSGEYFGYLESIPLSSTESRQSAATQLYFTVKEYNLLGFFSLNDSGLPSLTPVYILILSGISLPFALFLIRKRNVSPLIIRSKYFLVMIIGFLYLFLLIPLITPAKNILGANVSTSFTLTISLCGNGTIEGDEECEDDNLNGQSCQTKGYSAGALSCDQSCFFDTNACYDSSLTPTPTNTPSPTISLTPVPTNTPMLMSSSNNPAQVHRVTETPLSSPLPTQPYYISRSDPYQNVPPITPIPEATKRESTPTEPVPKTIIPVSLQGYDLNGDNRIDKELSEKASTDWINSYLKCQKKDIVNMNNFMSIFTKPTIYQIGDLNRDGSCNLTDFSIFLYYLDL